MNPCATITPVHSPDHIAAVARLAEEIWREYYVSITGLAQVDYMLQQFQSAPAITQQLADGYEYFLMVGPSQDVGYLAVRANHDDHSLFLSKIYVRQSTRGAGFGKQALQFVETLGRERGLKLIWLTVNKHNAHSIAWYQRLGFTNAGSLVQDIGGGFVMDDFRMEKPIG